jgi:hypothetical protein
MFWPIRDKYHSLPNNLGVAVDAHGSLTRRTERTRLFLAFRSGIRSHQVREKRTNDFTATRPYNNVPLPYIRMASKGGSLGRSSHTEGTKKPPLPSFNSTKPRTKSDASKEPAKLKENATESKHEKAEKTSEDSNSDPGNSTHNNKGEKDGNKTEAVNKTKGDNEKSEHPKKPTVRTMVIPSRYMNGTKATTPRTATPAPTAKAAPKPPTTSSGLRAKTPEKSAANSTTTERHAKTPTKLPGML